MKRNLFILVAITSTMGILRADVPEVVITTMLSANGHATIAGRLASKPKGPVGISVRNGNLSYSTVTDPEGRWGIVIRHQSTQVTANSWSLTDPTDQASPVVFSRVQLPWSRSVSGQGSSSSETSAKYQAETSLRGKIDSARSTCSSDQGSFSYSGGSVYCSKSGSSYQCSGNAYCTCS